MMTLRDALLVAIGGGTGAVLRWLAAMAARHWWQAPVAGIVVVNVSGCFLFGLLHGWCQARGEPWRLAILTGVLGGYTTFSTFGWDTFQLAQSGRPWTALAHAVGSVAAGFIAVWLGLLCASRQP